MKLTDCQAEALKDIKTGLLKDKLPMMKLTGFAGTGKTTLLAKIADQLKGPVYACAPTHKAAQVLGQKLKRPAVTIHSLLGLKLERDGKGGYELVQDKDKLGDLPDEGVIMLDESSMAGALLWEHITKTVGWLDNRIQWLFVGDPAQLPPVGEAPSPALEQPGPMLTEVVRQARDNPILDMATKVREGEPYLMSRFENGKGVGVTRNADGFLASAIDAFKRGDDARVLCYRNRTVNAYNNAIRTAVHGDEAPRFVPGDKLMARTTYFTPKMKIPLLNNSEEVVVVDAYEDRLHRAGGRRIAAWLLDIITADGREVEVPVLHEDAVQDYRDRLKEYRDEAKTKGTWSRYYKLAEAFADVEPCYAMTVHKSQGSTFHTVYVDHRDLMACRTDERQALTYVAVTRPSHRLALLV